jgi:hypothetical protein
MSVRHRAAPLVATTLLTLAAASALGASLGAQEREAAPVRGAPVRAAPSLPVGTFLASLIDRERLPVTDRVVDEDGTLYVIEFDRLVLSLRADLSFRASVRYRRTLFAADPRGRGRTAPLQTMTVSGRWELHSTTIRFIPDPGEDSKGLKMLAGTVTSMRELTIPFHYRNGTQARERSLVLRRNDDIL